MGLQSNAVVAAVLAWTMGVHAQYLTTCSNQIECGTVCTWNSDDSVAPSEGIWGTVSADFNVCASEAASAVSVAKVIVACLNVAV